MEKKEKILDLPIGCKFFYRKSKLQVVPDYENKVGCKACVVFEKRFNEFCDYQVCMKYNRVDEKNVHYEAVEE